MVNRWFYFFINIPKTLKWQFLVLPKEKVFFCYVPLWRRPMWMVVFTGVHQKPAASFIVIFRPERLVNHAEIVAMPLDGPGSIFRIFLLEPTHTFFEVQGSSYLLMIRWNRFQAVHANYKLNISMSSKQPSLFQHHTIFDIAYRIQNKTKQTQPLINK